MAKALFLIRGQNDGGRATELTESAVDSGLEPVIRTIHMDEITFNVSALPCFVVSVDGTQFATLEDREESPLDIASVVSAFNSAPSSLPPSPVAVVVPFDPNDESKTPKFIFTKSEVIGFQVEIKVGGARYTEFSGQWIVPVWQFNEYTKEFHRDIAIVNLTIMNGISDVVTIGPMNQSMVIGVDEKTSDLVRVDQLLISITE